MGVSISSIEAERALEAVPKIAKSLEEIAKSLGRAEESMARIAQELFRANELKALELNNSKSLTTEALNDLADIMV